MNQLEENIIQSFRLVKNDITELQRAMEQLHINQNKILEFVNDTRDKENELYQRVKGIKPEQKQPVIFVASRAGKSVHEPNCPFAKNIKQDTKVVFDTKAKAIASGYKLCECVKG